MVTYRKRLTTAFHDYEDFIGRPGTLRDAIDWGIETGRIAIPQIDPKAALIDDLKDALRAETRIDNDGREYRVNAAVKYTSEGGVQEGWWGDVDRKTTPDEFQVENFSQRRKGIVADCAKLQDDVDHFNAKRDPSKWVQLVLDFTDDVAEEKEKRKTRKKAA
jgi:hypothetical protein